MENKITLCLAVHDRVDDLDAHLAILDFSPEWRKIIICSNQNLPDNYKKKWEKKYELYFIKETSFQIGPLMAFTEGIRRSLDSQYMIYRNADDWLFNHKTVSNRLKLMISNDLDFAGYNWLTSDSWLEYAMNELTIKVDCIKEHVNRMENSFLNSSLDLLCEFKIARWINLCTKENKRLKLKERERDPAVGYELEILLEKAKAGIIKLPENWQFEWGNNNRYFHRQWQMIGSHDQNQRFELYKFIKPEISYCKELEENVDFKRWIAISEKKLPWNMKSPSKYIVKRKPAKNIPKFKFIKPSKEYIKL